MNWGSDDPGSRFGDMVLNSYDDAKCKHDSCLHPETKNGGWKNPASIFGEIHARTGIRRSACRYTRWKYQASAMPVMLQEKIYRRYRDVMVRKTANTVKIQMIRKTQEPMITTMVGTTPLPSPGMRRWSHP